MSLAVVGVSHKTAPVEIRERFVFERGEALEALERLRAEGGVRETVLLSTCNRTEIYLHPADSREAVERAEAILDEHAGDLPLTVEHYLYRMRGEEAVRQLFRVASGVDSMVLGEAEIQGQVRDAYQMASAAPVEPGLVGPVLSRLFETALSVGGRVRHETEIGTGAASVSSVAVELARKIFGDLRDRQVLILGAGETSELTVEALGDRGVRGVVVANRSFDRAEELASRLGGSAVSFDRVVEALREADIVVASTGAPHPVVTPVTFRTAFPEGPPRPFFLIDIALPRDIDPDLADEPNVFLYNIDDLQGIVDENVRRRKKHVAAAERIIEEEAEEFRTWLAGLEVVPLIRSLRARGEEIREAEVRRALGGLDHLDPEDRERVEELSRRILNKLLHAPTVRLREGVANGRGSGIVEAARFLFDLDPATVGDDGGDDGGDDDEEGSEGERAEPAAPERAGDDGS